MKGGRARCCCSQSLLLPLLLLLVGGATGRTVTVSNVAPRLDVDGRFVDAHDGTLLYHAGTFYLYGETTGNLTATRYPWGSPPGSVQPTIAVYTSPDLVTWTLRTTKAYNHNGGAGWIPSVIFDANTGRFVMWVGCGGWCVSTSYDGIHFVNTTLQWSRYGPGVGTDGTALFVDRDGTGYVLFSSLQNANHLPSIEKLAPDYLSSTGELIFTFPPSVTWVENGAIWRTATGELYAAVSSCCCACTLGSGLQTFWSPTGSMRPEDGGPRFQTQAPYGDVNCVHAGADRCGAFTPHDAPSDLVWHAQWAHVAPLPLNGTTMFVAVGRRWLSGPGHPASPPCATMCSSDACDAPGYPIARDFDVWQPLVFSPDGHVLPFATTKMDEFTVSLP